MDPDCCACGIKFPECILTSRAEPSYDFSKSAPWKKFPTDITKMAQDEGNKRLRHYMSCPQILSELHFETRQKAITALSGLKGHGSYVVMQGGTEEQWSYYQSDTLLCIFKQEQFFRYVFGCPFPDCYGVYDIDNDQTHLFVPQIADSARPFMGDMEPNEQIKVQWKLDGVHYVNEMEAFLKELDSKSPDEAKKCYILKGINNDSGIVTKNIADVSAFGLTASVDENALYDALEECRVVKTPKEVEMLRACCWISSMAHVYVMRHTTCGLEELFHEALFKSVCTIVGGSRNVAYNCICASKNNSAILHYGHSMKPNDRFIQNGELLLHDMGGIFPSGYLSDITVTYPVGGKFTKDQRIIYDSVLAANHVVQAAMKPGVCWIEMHKSAELEILKGLKTAGIIKSSVEDDSLPKLVEERLAGYFMPHGLGHLVGLDVHDCGAHDLLKKEGLKGLKGLGSLRCTRDLLAGMFITVEPGCYFIGYLMEQLKSDDKLNDYIDFNRLNDFMDMGGVRIEDDVIVTEDGCINFTIVPRTADEIKAMVSPAENSGIFENLKKSIMRA